MKKTNFDRYLEEQMADPAFAARIKHAGEAWDVGIQRQGKFLTTKNTKKEKRNS